MRSLKKKAQIGETMTWAVATIIIIVFSMVFLYVTNSIPKISLPFLSITSSGVSETNQQMLFAMLKIEPNMDKTTIQGMLNGFQASGVGCSFETPDFSIDRGGTSGLVSLKYRSKEVSFRC